MKIVKSLEKALKLVEKTPALMLYMSQPSCNVCKQLKPKIINMLQDSFPEVEFCYIDVQSNPEIGGRFSVFTVPTIITYFDSKEFMRYGRNLGIGQLRSDLERPYNIFFDE